LKIVFFASNKRREVHLAKAFLAGAKSHGVKVERRDTNDIPKETDYQYACMVGVKSARLWTELKRRGVTPIMFDKGYSRRRYGIAWQYWRVSVGTHHPAASLRQVYPSDRFFSLGFNVSPGWKRNGSHILLAGSSAKYHKFYNMADPTAYAKDVVKQIRRYSDRPIIYRPKPSWSGAVTIKGTKFSHDGTPLIEDLRNAHCVVTHGSNACFDAAVTGIPSIVLGDGVMRSISSHTVSAIEDPKRGERMPLFFALAYHQWTLEEMQSGEAFETIKDWL
jgi:hypothetical protein